jgi:hypothetical protein
VPELFGPRTSLKSESENFGLRPFELGLGFSVFSKICSNPAVKISAGDTSPQFKFRDQMLVSPDCDMLGGGMLPFWNETDVMVSKR